MSWLTNWGSGFDFKDVGSAIGLHGLKPMTRHIEDQIGLHGWNGLGKAQGTNALIGALVFGGSQLLGSGTAAGPGGGEATGGEAVGGSSGAGSGNWFNYGRLANLGQSLFSGGSNGGTSSETQSTSGGSMGFLDSAFKGVVGGLTGGLTGGLLGGAQGQGVAKSQFEYQKTASDQINNLLTNPASITSMPGYGAGHEAVMRTIAAQGGNLSGNQLTALQDWGQTYYNQQLSILGQLASGFGNTANAANTSSSMASGGLGGIMSLLGGKNALGGSSGILGQLGGLFGGGAATGGSMAALGGDAGMAAGASDLAGTMAMLA